MKKAFDSPHHSVTHVLFLETTIFFGMQQNCFMHTSLVITSNKKVKGQDLIMLIICTASSRTFFCF